MAGPKRAGGGGKLTRTYNRTYPGQSRTTGGAAKPPEAGHFSGFAFRQTEMSGRRGCRTFTRTSEAGHDSRTRNDPGNQDKYNPSASGGQAGQNSPQLSASSACNHQHIREPSGANRPKHGRRPPHHVSAVMTVTGRSCATPSYARNRIVDRVHSAASRDKPAWSTTLCPFVTHRSVGLIQATVARCAGLVTAPRRCARMPASVSRDAKTWRKENPVKGGVFPNFEFRLWAGPAADFS